MNTEMEEKLKEQNNRWIDLYNAQRHEIDE